MIGHIDNSGSTDRPTSGQRLPSSPTDTGVERIGGITRTETSSPMSSPIHSSRDEKPLKDQWVWCCLIL